MGFRWGVQALHERMYKQMAQEKTRKQQPQEKLVGFRSIFMLVFRSIVLQSQQVAFFVKLKKVMWREAIL
jgi:hypothetical protein